MKEPCVVDLIIGWLGYFVYYNLPCSVLYLVFFPTPQPDPSPRRGGDHVARQAQLRQAADIHGKNLMEYQSRSQQLERQKQGNFLLKLLLQLQYILIPFKNVGHV